MEGHGHGQGAAGQASGQQGVPPQQYCMRWNTHGSTLLAEFTSLLASTALVDVTLFAEGHTLKAHKVVLSACSPYFKRLFAETNEGHPIVVLKDVGHQELRCLLEYMYRGEVNVAQDQLGPLIRTAESLRIKGLADGPSTTPGPLATTPGSAPTPPAELSRPKTPPQTPVTQDRIKVKTEGSDSLTALTEGRIGPSDARTSLGRSGVPGEAFTLPPSSVPSVLSKVLTMPPALSLASSVSLPHDTPVRPGSPPSKRRRWRRSGEHDSGESDSRSSASPGDPLHSLPRIPATITPVSAPNTHPHHQHREEEERNISGSGGSSSPSPDSLGGSSRGDTAPVATSPQPRPLSAHDQASTSSPFKPFLARADENSSDANHHSDGEEERMSRAELSADTPGPSTSRLPPADDPPQTPSYLGWPYPPDPSTSNESSPFPSLENTNQGLLLCEGWLATGLWGGGRGGGEGRGGRRERSLERNGGGGGHVATNGGGGGGNAATNGRERDDAGRRDDRRDDRRLEDGRREENTGQGSGITHSCPKCSRTYTLRSNLSRHMRLECGVERRYRCPFCHKRFSHAHHLRSHEKSIHAHPTPSQPTPTPAQTS